MSEMKLTKITLNNGQTISFHDTGAIHYDSTGRLVVGDARIDNLLIRRGLTIVQLEDVTASDFEDSKIVIQDKTTGAIKGHSANNLLEDIGGCSYNLDNDGTLTLKLGKQQQESEGE